MLIKTVLDREYKCFNEVLLLALFEAFVVNISVNGIVGVLTNSS